MKITIAILVTMVVMELFSGTLNENGTRSLAKGLSRIKKEYVK
jgi:hypothetical protein